MKDYSQYLKARNCCAAGNYKKALKMYQNLYCHEPENELINYGMGYTLLCIYKDIYNHPEIEAEIRKHCEKSKLLGIAVLGTLEEQLGNAGEARKKYKKAIKFGDKDAFFYLIRLEHKLGNVENAQLYYDNYLEDVKNNYGEDDDQLNFSYLKFLGLSAMILNDIEVAEKIFEFLRTHGYRKKHSIQCLMTIEAKKGNYKEAYQRHLELCNLDEKSDEYSSLFVLYKLHKLDADYPTHHQYSKKQFLEYSLDDAKSHVDKKNGKRFLDNVDSIFNTCNISIQNLEPIEKAGSHDKYIWEFENNIAIKFNKPTNRVVIITIPDTKDILTIYPTITENKRLIQQPSTVETLREDSKVKRKSPIEKFNNRYHL